MNGEAGARFFEIDAILAGAVAVEGTIGATNDAKAIGMFFKKIGGEDVKLA